MGLGTSYNNTINALSVQQEPHYKRVQVEMKLKYSVKVTVPAPPVPPIVLFVMEYDDKS